MTLSPEKKAKILEYLESSLTTFLSTAIPTFFIALDTQLETNQAITGSVIMGIFFASVRAGFRVLIKSLVANYK